MKVSEQSIGRCKADFLEAGETALVAGKSGPSTREPQLEAEVAELAQALSEAAVELRGRSTNAPDPPTAWRVPVSLLGVRRVISESGGIVRRFSRVLTVGAVVVAASIPVSVSAQTTATATSSALFESQLPDLRSQVDGDPTRFAGIYEDQSTGVVHIVAGANGGAVDVVSMTSKASSDSAVAASGSSFQVQVDEVPYAYSDLKPIMDGITGSPDLSSAGITNYYVDPRTDAVFVGISGDASPYVQGLVAKYGDRIHVAHHDAFTTFTNRLADSTPYYSGDRIENKVGRTNPTYFQCTVGMKFKVGSALYMTTAGHCGAQGAGWNQGYVDASGPHSTGSMGTVTTVQYGNGRLDAELIGGGSYSPTSWVGSVSSPTTKHVTGAVAAINGSSVCANGSFTGEVCSATVIALNECVAVTNLDTGASVNTCYQDEMTKSGTRLAQWGDSGASVLQNNSQGIGISGTVTAGNDAGDDCVFSDIGAIDSVFGGAPATT